MSEARSSNGWPLAGLMLGAGLLVGFVAGQNNVPPPNPEERSLDSGLYVQTSAEFRACCYQIYHFAEEQLRRNLARPANDPRPPAVVMDLDETVFDNSPQQVWRYRRGEPFRPATWNTWERTGAREVRVIPGADRFIREAEKAGVTVVYLSNRREENRQHVADALKHLGISVKDIEGRLELAAGTTNKEERRKKVEKRYRVVLHVGDNLRDFSEDYAAGKVPLTDAEAVRKRTKERFALVERDRALWGTEYVVIPNPNYGEWRTLASRRPQALLQAATMK